MKLGKYFTLEELIRNNHGFANVTNAEQTSKLKVLVTEVLDPAREMFGRGIDVSSGYRCPELNKEVGGADDSQHLKAEAADLKCSDNAKLFSIIRLHLVFDQLIWEGGDDKQPAWVHVSYSTKHNRSEVLRMKVVNGKKVYSHI